VRVNLIRSQGQSRILLGAWEPAGRDHIDNTTVHHGRYSSTPGSTECCALCSWVRRSMAGCSRGRPSKSHHPCKASTTHQVLTFPTKQSPILSSLSTLLSALIASPSGGPSGEPNQSTIFANGGRPRRRGGGAQTRDRFAPTPLNTRGASSALELALTGPRGQAAWALQETADDHEPGQQESKLPKLPKLQAATGNTQPARRKLPPRACLWERPKPTNKKTAATNNNQPAYRPASQRSPQ